MASEVLILVPFEIPALGVCEKLCILIIIYSYLVLFVKLAQVVFLSPATEKSLSKDHLTGMDVVVKDGNK